MVKFSLKKKKQSKPSVPRAPRRAPDFSQATSPHEPTLIGLTDPFSGEAARAQYPDSGAGRSLTYQMRLSTAVATDINGAFALAVNPKINYNYLISASTAANVVTWAAAWSNNVGTNLVNAYASAYRPTSYGLRYTNTLSATSSSGYIVIAKAGSPTVGATTTFTATNFTSWDAHANTHGAEFVALGHPKTANAYDMQPAGSYSTNTGDGNSAWETVFIHGSGLPVSVAVGFLDVYINYEYVPVEDSPIASLAVPQPTLNIQMQTAVNHVQSQHPTSHKGMATMKAFAKREGKKALVKHVLPFVQKNAMKALVAL